MVKPIGWFSHLAVLAAGLDPLRSPLFAGLAADLRIVTYDRYGVGLSRGADVDFSFETSVAELVTVIEILDLRDIIMFGESAAAAIAIGAAAMVPERVSRLVLLGGYASGPDLYPPCCPRADAGSCRDILGARRPATHLAVISGGECRFAGCLDPSATQVGDEGGGCGIPGTARSRRRRVTSPSPDLGAHSHPPLPRGPGRSLRGSRATSAATTNVCRVQDGQLKSLARALATRLPDARLVPLEGIHHLPPPGHIERVAEVIARFCSSI